MKPLHLDFSILALFLILCSTAHVTAATVTVDTSHRRILHQPLYPADPPPAPESSPPAPPSPDNSDQPFFHEAPTGQNSDQTPPPPTLPNGGAFPNPTATQPNKQTKGVAIAISVGIVTLGMLSALAFFIYRHRAKHAGETQKLVGGNSQRALEESSRTAPSSFLYIGTVDPISTQRSITEVNGENGANGSPYHKLNSVKRSERYRPSPELQPLPPLSREQKRTSSSAAMSSSDEDSPETFYTPNGSSTLSIDDGPFTPVLGQNYSTSNNNNSGPGRVPHSKRTSPKTRLSSSSPDIKFAIIPSIKQQPPPAPPPPPLEQPWLEQSRKSVGFNHQRPKFSSSAPPPPNMSLLHSITKPNIPAPPPPPPPTLAPPLPPPLMTTQPLQSSSPKDNSKIQTPIPVKEEVTIKSESSLERLDSDEFGGKPKLKALHWDKVRAVSNRATVWDQLKSSSFQLNEDMMETLFGCNSENAAPKAAMKPSVAAPVEQENRVLDPKKSQNIAILLRALNVTRDEVSEALLDGTMEGLGAELLETLVKMAPTKEEEIKLRDYNGDISKLGSAERFLKSILDIPFAFKRVEAMLYRANFDTEIKYLRKSFQTLEAASEELKNSRLFLKLLEAVLRAGNRMNVGTNRGDAKAFKLDTLLKLVDIKAIDGKTTLLHFVVQEIIRTEGTFENNQGLQIVSGLSRDLSNVKKAAGMDSDVLSGYVSKLQMGLEKVKMVSQYEKPNMQGRFFESMKGFLREAEHEIDGIKSDEKKALSLVKEATEYFHGDTVKEEAHPLRIFLIVRDFFVVLDNVCKEVGRMQDRESVGSARSFRISSSASLPVLNRYNFRKNKSSDEESASP